MDCKCFCVNCQVFRARTPPEAIELVARLLEYTPSARISPLQACAHPFFNDLREPGTRLPNGNELPPLFNFTDHELSIQPSLNGVLIPRGLQSNQAEGGQDGNVAGGIASDVPDAAGNAALPNPSGSAVA